MNKNWSGWHNQYNDPRSGLVMRAELTHHALRKAMSLAPGAVSEPLDLVSMCAGEGRDLLPVLAAPGTGRRISATLIEIDPDIASRLSASASALGLSDVSVHVADAGLAESYRELPPAHVLLASGVFGNISDADVGATIRAIPAFLADGGLVVWTRSRRSAGTDTSQHIQARFEERGFECVSSDLTPDGAFRVAVHRFTGHARREDVPGDLRLFAFQTDPDNLSG